MDRLETVSDLDAVLTRRSKTREVPKCRDWVGRYTIALVCEVLSVYLHLKALSTGIRDVPVDQCSLFDLGITLLLNHRRGSSATLEIGWERTGLGVVLIMHIHVVSDRCAAGQILKVAHAQAIVKLRRKRHF